LSEACAVGYRSYLLLLTTDLPVQFGLASLRESNVVL
jgi:hypothetical protein